MHDSSGAVLWTANRETGIYKLPGGGVEPGESDEDDLRRELLEECGVHLSVIGGPLVEVSDVRRDREGPGCFHATTICYPARQRDGERHEPRRLHDYEHANDLVAVWERARVALQRMVVADERHRTPPWHAREMLTAMWLIANRVVK